MLYAEKYRPQFHFSPKSNWMNDPNGLVYYEGEYHLFYQYHPYSTVWGPMHWGHAVSKDLIHWDHLPTALAPDEYGTIFSGSAVVDWHDTSGFFQGGVGLVAIFTHADIQPGMKRKERQSIAYSADKGRTWTKYDGNPVLIDESMTDFRDPKVFWHVETNKWIMVLVARDRVRFYSSPNLKEWILTSEFGADEGSHLGVWECPDLFELPVDGCKKWVLIVSMHLGGNPTTQEGSKTQYFIGEFDGTHFINDNSSDTVLWLDHGRDNYAGVSWSDLPAEDGRLIYIGWMSNWKYARLTPTDGWRSAMTLPRELTLKSGLDGIKLFQNPVRELEKLRKLKHSWNNAVIGANSSLLSDVSGDTLEIIAEFELNTAKEFGLKVRKSDSEETVIGFDADSRILFVDRTESGVTDFFEHFAGRHGGPLQIRNNRIQMRLLIDRSSVEVFGNDGELAITEQIFPDPGSKGLELYAKDGEVKLISLHIYSLNAIWEEII